MSLLKNAIYKQKMLKLLCMFTCQKCNITEEADTDCSNKKCSKCGQEMQLISSSFNSEKSEKPKNIENNIK